MKWEYRLFPSGLDREEHVIEEALNSLGKDGWDLVAIYESRLPRVCPKRAVRTMIVGVAAARLVGRFIRAYAPIACS